jgi:hypothetical protein
VRIKSVSYSPIGEWKSAPKSLCDRYLCTPSGLSWMFKPETDYYSSKAACDGLIAKGINKIYFHGDSFMRQIYAALLITLNGDYRYGSLANSTLSPHCEYHRQFYEKKCGTRDLNHHGVVCNGRVILDPYLNGITNVDHCSNQNGTLVVWSFGNYKTTRYGRTGVNDPKLYQEMFEKDICDVLKQDYDGPKKYSGPIASHPCSMWWISTHYRVRGIFEDETAEKIQYYNEQMRLYFDTKKCGDVNYVDVYNMTRELGINHNAEAITMTYDQVHWGFEVNLIKAQILLSAILSVDR